MMSDRQFTPITHHYEIIARLFFQRIANTRIYLLHTLLIQLYHLAVVSHQAVHFHLHIRGLCIDGCRETSFYHLIQHIGIFHVLISHFFGRVEPHLAICSVQLFHRSV